MVRIRILQLLFALTLLVGVVSAEYLDEDASDLGFRPDPDGFSFENYGNDDGVENLTEREMFRLFGDCAFRRTRDGRQFLKPQARQWMKALNENMDGGHCEGIAVASLLFYSGALSPEDYGAEEVVYLKVGGNSALMREIALWYATQATFPSGDAEIEEPPAAIVDRLEAAFDGPESDNPHYTIGVYKPDGSDGHAVTPYAVRWSDDESEAEILVYDNNFPEEPRAIHVDLEDNTWSYMASTNPREAEALYEGDARTLSLTLTPLAPRLKRQDCVFDEEAPFTAAKEGVRGGGAFDATDDEVALAKARGGFLEILTDGPADLLIVDDRGRRLGFVDSGLVNEIPGASVRRGRGGTFRTTRENPDYIIPAGIEFVVAISGARLSAPAECDVTVFGPGFEILLEGIMLDPGAVDSFFVSPAGNRLSYDPAGFESPDLTMGFRTTDADYEFTIEDFEVDEDGYLEMSVDYAEGWVRAAAPESSADVSMNLYALRLDNQGEHEFESDDFALAPGEAAWLAFRDWEGEGAPMEFFIDDDDEDDEADRSGSITNKKQAARAP